MPTPLVPLLLTLCAPPGSTGTAALPLARLRLYETGVAYFERRGRVSSRGDLTLPIPTSHLDDALKTLVVLDANGSAKVEGIAFSTAVSEGMARAIAGLPDEAERVEYLDLLRSLEGTRVEVVSGDGRVRGRLIDVEGPFAEVAAARAGAARSEEKSAPSDPPPPPQYRLLVLGEDGDVHRVATDDVTSVRPLDRGVASRLGVAAEALSGHTARFEQQLDIEVEGGGQLGLGYIAEAPVWRTSYRVVLGDASRPARLQGWALVHNDTDEDWHDVQIEFVNGRPDSFLFPLAAPRYARRELVTPTDELSTVPQLATTTPDRMWLDGWTGAEGLGLVGTGRGGGGSGEGTIGVGSYGTIGQGTGGGAGPSLGDLAALSQANGEPQGALFVYSVEAPVDLDAHHSALLPIVSDAIEAESITWFPSGEFMGFTGVRLVNSTTQTLPEGTVSFFTRGGFVGETMLDRLGPTERRFLAYGAELDVELQRFREEVGRRTLAVAWRGSELVEQLVVTSALVLTIDNRSRREQRVYVALDLPRNAQLRTNDAAVELDFDLETATPLAAADVPSRVTKVVRLEADTGETRNHDHTDEVTLTVLAEREGLPEAMKAVLLRALEHRRDADRHAREARDAERKVEDLEADLVRIRKDLEALGQAQVRGRLRAGLGRELLHKEEALVSARRARRRAQREATAAARQVVATLEALEEHP